MATGISTTLLPDQYDTCAFHRLMGRWRPPAPKSAPYITPEGYKILEDESAALWTKRHEVTKALAAAAAEGDRSENAEYIYRKKQLREIDSRITYLQKRMPKLKVVRQVEDTRRVFFGAWVTLEDEAGQEQRHRIVGADEFDQQSDYITVDSPLARLVLGKSVDDEVVLERKGVEQTLFIIDIEYEDQD